MQTLTLPKLTIQTLNRFYVRLRWDLYLNLPEFFNNNPGKFDENPGKSSELPKSLSRSYTLPKVQINPQVIRAWIRLLSEIVATRLRERNLVSATVHLWLNGPEIGNFGAQKTYQAQTNDGLWDLSKSA